MKLEQDHRVAEDARRCAEQEVTAQKSAIETLQVPLSYDHQGPDYLILYSTVARVNSQIKTTTTTTTNPYPTRCG